MGDEAISLENKTLDYKPCDGRNLSEYLGRKCSEVVRNVGSGILAHTYLLCDLGQVNEPLLASVASSVKYLCIDLIEVIVRTK